MRVSIDTREFQHFGIDDARELRARATQRAFGDSHRLFVITCTVFSPEAQNALLKTFEEPSAQATFCIITPSPESLLPTVRSRSYLHEKPKSRVGSELTRTFVSTPPRARIDLLKSLIDKDAQDKRDIQGIITFLSELEGVYSAHIEDPLVREGLRSVYRARVHVQEKGALIKPLLEQVALLAPVL